MLYGGSGKLEVGFYLIGYVPFARLHGAALRSGHHNAVIAVHLHRRKVGGSLHKSLKFAAHGHDSVRRGIDGTDQRHRGGGIDYIFRSVD